MSADDSDQHATAAYGSLDVLEEISANRNVFEIAKYCSLTERLAQLVVDAARLRSAVFAPIADEKQHSTSANTPRARIRSSGDEYFFGIAELRLAPKLKLPGN